VAASRLNRSPFWPGLGAFFVGISLIVSATVLNVAYDGMTLRDQGRLTWLMPLYTLTDQFGVTLVLVVAGLLVIVAGIVIRALCQPRRVNCDEEMLVNATPSGAVAYKATPRKPGKPTRAQVVLSTAKYMTPGAPRAGLPANEPTPPTVEKQPPAEEQPAE
jgi:hypothetical protein